MPYMVDGQLTKNFSIAEFCNKQAKENVKGVLTPEVYEHADMLQELRDWYNKPLNVSSWYRTRSFNKEVGGASNSLHLKGLATDINNIPESLFHDFTVAWQVICKAHNKIGGVNYYKWGMHFSSKEDEFGATDFVIRDKR